jgi:hypothetical protein
MKSVVDGCWTLLERSKSNDARSNGMTQHIFFLKEERSFGFYLVAVYCLLLLVVWFSLSLEMIIMFVSQVQVKKMRMVMHTREITPILLIFLPYLFWDFF